MMPNSNDESSNSNSQNQVCGFQELDMDSDLNNELREENVKDVSSPQLKTKSSQE